MEKEPRATHAFFSPSTTHFFFFCTPQVVTTMDDNESSIDKNSLYHEPFNANMYTSAASACPMNDLQRQHVSPDYTGESVNVHCEKSLVLGGVYFKIVCFQIVFIKHF